MKVKFSKRQIFAILLSTLAAAALVCCVIFIPRGSDPGGIPDPGIPIETPPAHNPFRAPRPALDPDLVWETNFGGSKNETVVASYGVASGMLLFGNSESTDYDFADKSAGWFAMLVGYDGKMIHTRAYPGILTAVEPVETEKNGQGFLLCVNYSGVCLVIRTDALGAELYRAELQDSENEKIIGVYTDYFISPAEPFHAIIEYTNPDTRIRQLRIEVLSDKLERVFKHWSTNRNLDLQFVAAYAHPTGYYLFANIIGRTSTQLTYYNWTKNSSTEQEYKNLDIPTLTSYTCDAVVPAGGAAGRYAMLIRDGQDAPYLAVCTNNFYNVSLRKLANSPALGTKLLTDGNENIYAYVYLSGDITQLHRFDRTFLEMEFVEKFNVINALYCHTENEFGTLFCGQTADSIIIDGMNKDGVYMEILFASVSEKIRAMIPIDNGVMLIGESRAKGLNVGGNFGETDIWVTKVEF